MKKLATIFVIVMSLMFNITAFAFNYNTETMYVGINAEYPPFEYIENGEYKGFDIELMQYLGERKNFNVEFVNMDFDEMMVAVQTGKVDCAISGICITEERKQHLEFTDAYMDCNVTYVENGETVQSEESYAIALAKDTIFDSMLNSAIADAKQAKIPQLAEKYGLKINSSTGNYEYTVGDYTSQNEENTELSNSAGTKFNDVLSNHWASTYIEDMANRGIITGYGDGLFGPNDQITRAQFATMLCRAAELSTTTNASTFSDVSSSDWFAQYVEAAKPYISGYNNNSYFNPNTNAIREDIAIALVKYKNYDISAYDEEVLKNTFTDWQEINSNARPYVYAAVKNKLINGYDDNTFRGQANITRAEAATLFWKMLK